MGAIHFSLDERLLAFFTRRLPLEVFVETGTYKGDSLRLGRRFFQECHSVEMSPQYFAQAQQAFAGDSGIHLHLGDSTKFLQDQPWRQRPALFWLDAHWCVAENTAGENSQSPLLGELAAIGALPSQSVLLVDDARLYLCPPPAPHRAADWPGFHSVVQGLLRLSLQHHLMVLNDVLIFFPASLEKELSQFACAHGADWLQLASQARKYQAKKDRLRRLKRWCLPFGAKR